MREFKLYSTENMKKMYEEHIFVGLPYIPSYYLAAEGNREALDATNSYNFICVHNRN